MTDWASLRDTYGPAEEVPVLLAAVEEAGTDDGGPWEELWTRLYHQGTVYSASYAVLPVLANMSRRHSPSGYIGALHLAATIIAAREGPEDSASVRRRYENELADLGAVAVVNLQHANDDTELVYGLEALMAFEDGGVWQRNLHCLSDGELELDCRSCDEHLVVDFEAPEVRVESFADGSLAPTVVTPAEPPPVTVESRLLTLARASGRPAVAGKLTHLFGTATCPRCLASFRISDTLT